MKTKIKNLATFALLCVSLFACAKVTVKDAEFCGDLGEYGASCFHTLSDKERDIEKEAWDQERFGMICTTAESFANWKEALLQLCHERKNLCSFEEVKAIESISVKMAQFYEVSFAIKQLEKGACHGSTHANAHSP